MGQGQISYKVTIKKKKVKVQNNIQIITDQRHVQKTNQNCTLSQNVFKNLRKLYKTQKNSIIRIRKIRNEVTEIRKNLIYI